MLDRELGVKKKLHDPGGPACGPINGAVERCLNGPTFVNNPLAQLPVALTAQ